MLRSTSYGQVSLTKSHGSNFHNRNPGIPGQIPGSNVPSQSLTVSLPLKIGLPKRKFIFQPSIFRGELLNFGRAILLPKRVMGFPVLSVFKSFFWLLLRVCHPDENMTYSSKMGCLQNHDVSFSIRPFIFSIELQAD